METRCPGVYIWLGHPSKTSMSGWTCCSSGLPIHLVYIMYWQYKQILLKQPPMTAEVWSHPVAGRSPHHPWTQAWRCGTMACPWSTRPMRVWLVTTQRRNMPPPSNWLTALGRGQEGHGHCELDCCWKQSLWWCGPQPQKLAWETLNGTSGRERAWAGERVWEVQVRCT